MAANQRSTKAASQKSDGELIAQALRDVFISPNELDRNWEPAGVVDALFSVSRALSEIAQAMRELHQKLGGGKDADDQY